MADYYELLGVSRDADDEAIKRAYRKLALEHHPDRNDGAKASEERFKEVTRAYEVLRDPDQRSVYDRYGEAGLKGGGGGAGGATFDFGDAIEVFMRDFGGFSGFGDIFGARRGGGPGSRDTGPSPGQPVRIRLPLTLRDVAEGTHKTLRVALLDVCDRCEGSGAEPGSAPEPCPSCGGSGEERVVQRSVFGQLVSVQPCRRCRGEGRIVDDPCARCHAEGRVRSERDVDVEVPPGVTSENYITLRGQGNAGPRGGSRGDLIVLLEVEEDARFERDGDDLLHERPITVTQAVLGDEIEVPTVLGSTRLTVPPGTQSGEVLRLRGQGLPHLQGAGRGDLLVRVAVWTPERLTSEQEEAYRRLRDVEEPAPERVERGRRGFWSRVKEAFGA